MGEEPIVKLANDSSTESDDHEDEDGREDEENEENSLDMINRPLGGNLGTPGKRKKPGIIFLSSVPPGMNVSQTISFFSDFGRVGRVFLQPDKNDKKGGKYNRVFSEGWVEFLSKKVARAVAENLNNNPVGGKRKSKAHDHLWNIKYLPRFKWVHLSERLAYESAVRQQRLRTEISQVKREAEHFKNSVQIKRKKAKKEKETKSSHEDSSPAAAAATPFKFKQRETEAQIRKRKRDIEESVEDTTVSPSAKKKPKKDKEKVEGSHSQNVKKAKSKKSKKPRQDKGTSSKKSKDGGDRSAFLKSVFGGGT